MTIDPTTDDLIVSDGPYLYRVSSRMKPNLPVGVATSSHPRSLTFSACGRVLYAGMTSQLLVLDVAELKETARFTDPELTIAAHEDRIVGLAVHPTGAFVASNPSGAGDRRVKIWEAASGRLMASLAIPGAVPLAVVWSPDGRYLLVTTAGETLRFELVPSEAARDTLHWTHPIRAVAYSAGGDTIGALAEGSDDAHSWYLAEHAGRPSIAMLPVPGDVGPGIDSGIAIAPDCNRLAISLARSGCLTFDLHEGTSPKQYTARNVRCPHYISDGSALWAIVDSSSAVVWDARTGFRRGVFTNSGSVVLSGLPGLESLAVGDTRAVVGARDGSVYLLSERAARLATYQKSGDPVISLAMARDESLIAAGTRAGAIRLIAPGSQLEHAAVPAHPGGVAAVAFSPDGRWLASGGKDRAVRLWQRTHAGVELILTVDALPAPVAAIEFGNNGQELLVLLTNERAVHVWNLEQLRRQLATLMLDW